MKKALCLVLLSFLLIVPVFAAGTNITVTIPQKAVLIGDQYYVTVSVSGNPGFSSMQLELFYDDAVMECVKVIPGDVVKGMLCDSNPRAAGSGTSAILSAAGSSNIIGDGTLATFVFDKPKSGDPAFSFVLTEIRNTSGAQIAYNTDIKNSYTDTDEDPPETNPPATNPPETNPPETNPPETQPSIPQYPPSWPPFIWETEPPVTNPPETYPPQTTVPDPLPPARDPKLDLPAFQEIPQGESMSFADVGAVHWAYAYISEASARGVLEGYPDNTFQPENEMTRAEFTTLLWKLAGRPSVIGVEPFRDVSYKDWYRTAVVWAYQNGYIQGVTSDTFSPNGTITREQAMTILYRYTDNPPERDSLFGFADKDSISPYAEKAMSWAVSVGIITGVDAMHLAPGANATRAQMSAIMVRYIHYIQSLSTY
jgi:hypothetical protein